MAARRSRLQIKPNIGGAAKAPSIKSSTPKSPVKSPSIEPVLTSPTVKQTRSRSPVKSPSVEPVLKSPTVKQPRSRSPVKSPTVDLRSKDPFTKAVGLKSPIRSVSKKDQKNAETRIKSPTRNLNDSRKGSVDGQFESKSTDDGSSKENAADEHCVIDHIGSAKKDSSLDRSGNEKDAEQTKLLSVPTRERFRRFGKVNIATAKSVKPAVPLEIDKPDNLEKDEEKASKDDLIKKESSVPVNTRRSRFPKAKPNIDAGKRKQREDPEAGDDAVKPSISQSDSQSQPPEITVTDTTVDDNENSTVQDSSIQETEKAPESVMLTQLKPPTAPTPTPKSPLKAPTPNVFMSPEKRARTLSTAEPPVAKRQRKPKVDVPTDQPPDRSTMKMRDLIRWNPSNNPMKPKATRAKDGGVETATEKENQSSKTADVVEEEEPADSALPVPQVTIGPDGNIVINEKSLVVKDPELDKSLSQDDEIIDETEVYTTYSSFRKHRTLSKRWTKKETKKFYKALAMIGTDFFLIKQLFPSRSREEIKKKYKKEERMNRHLVERVMRDGIKLDPKIFEAPEEMESSDDEEEEEMKKRPKKKKEPKEKQNTAKKKPIKRQNRPLNYYKGESSTEDEEEPVQKKRSSSKDGPWQPPNIKKGHRDVAGTLVDMSKHSMPSTASPEENTVEKLTAVPLNKHKYLIEKIRNKQKLVQLSGEATLGNAHVVIQDNKTFTNTGARNNQNINANPNASRGNNHLIPGVDSVSILQTQHIQPSLLQDNVAAGQSNSRQSSLPVTNGALSSSVSSENVSTNQLLASQNQSNQVQITLNSVPNIGLQDISGAEDQYVLVTVVPEGGGETVIHIYKLHGSQVLGSEADTEASVLQQTEGLPDNFLNHSEETSVSNAMVLETTPGETESVPDENCSNEKKDSVLQLNQSVVSQDILNE